MAIPITNYKSIHYNPFINIEKINISNKDRLFTNFDINLSLDYTKLNSGLDNFTIDVGIFYGEFKQIHKQILKHFNFNLFNDNKTINQKAFDSIASDTRQLAADLLTSAPFTEKFRNLENVKTFQINTDQKELTFSIDDPQNVIMVFYVVNNDPNTLNPLNLKKGSVTISVPFYKNNICYDLNGTLEKQVLFAPNILKEQKISKVQDERFFDSINNDLNFNPATRHLFTNVQKRVKNSRVVNTPLEETSFKNNYQRFSSLFLSEQENESVNGFFFVNIKNILFEESSYPFLLKDPELLDMIMATYKIDKNKSIRIIKTLIRKPTEKSQTKLSENNIGEFLTEFRTFSSAIAQSQIKNVTDSISANFENLSNDGVEAFSFKDKLKFDQSNGKYFYQALINFNDPTVLLLNSVFESIQNNIGSFNHIKNMFNEKENLRVDTINDRLRKSNLNTLENIFTNLSTVLLITKTLNNDLKMPDILFDNYIKNLQALLNPQLSLEKDIIDNLLRFNQQVVEFFDSFILSIGKNNRDRSYNFSKTNRKSFSDLETVIEIDYPFKETLTKNVKSLFGYRYFKNPKTDFVKKDKIVSTALEQLSKILNIQSKNSKNAIAEISDKFSRLSSDLTILDTAFCYYTFNQFIGISDKFEFNNNKDPLNDLKNNNLNYKLLFSDLSYEYANITKQLSLDNNPHIKDTNNVSNLDVLDYNKLVLVLLTKLNFKFFTDQLTEDVDEALTKVEIGNTCAEAASENTRNNFNFSQNYNSEFVTNFIEDNKKIINLLLNYGLKDEEKINDYLNFVSNFNEDFIRNLINDKTLNSLAVPTQLKALILGLNSKDLSFFTEEFKNKIQNNDLQEPYSYNTFNNNILFVKKLVTLRGFSRSTDFGLDLKKPIWAPVTLNDLQNRNVIFCKLEDYYNDELFYKKNKIDKFKIFNQYFLAR
jgi:hypothetical protein